MFLEFIDFISDVSEPIGVSHGRGTSYLASEYPILDYFEKSKNKVFKMKEIIQKRTKAVWGVATDCKAAQTSLVTRLVLKG